jgi:pimeloyl-ACP methyl ester carboxylesterase
MLHYQSTEKKAKQIIFIHGNSQSLQLWDEVIDDKELKEVYQLIAADLPGHGKSFISKQPDKDYTIPGMANHLNEFILSLNPSDFIIVAHSMGTNLVGEIALSLKNCKGIFFTGACIAGGNVKPGDILMPNPNLIPFFTPQVTDEALDKMLVDGLFNPSAESKQKCKDMYIATDPAFREQWMASISREEWTDEIEKLNQLAVPVAVVYGENDNFAVKDYLKGLITNEWKNKIITIPAVGHFMQFDQLKALFNLIKEFADDCFK